MCNLDRANISFVPHKFKEFTNMNIPSTRIDINPKYFECFNDMFVYLRLIFGGIDMKLEEFNITRADIAADIEDFPIKRLLCRLHVQKINSDSLSFYKGTIYAGSDPKIRIYDKTKQLKALKAKKYDITEYEEKLLESGKRYTRFEVQKRHLKKTLKEFSEDPLCLLYYFDRLDIFNFEENFNSGVMQYFYRLIPRKTRNELDKYKNGDIVEEIKKQCAASIQEWFIDKEPF